VLPEALPRVAEVASIEKQVSFLYRPSRQWNDGIICRESEAVDVIQWMRGADCDISKEVLQHYFSSRVPCETDVAMVL
jgi:hypothetical protein